WHIPPGQFRGIAGLDLAGLGIPDEASYIRAYCERTGRDVAALIRNWDFCIAYNMFRLAAILQGIVRRVVDGTAANATAPETADRVRPLAASGWRFAQRQG
ncbi:MAG: phosphotransferase family protein, partial [Burkholderiaceae bacterium]|nr:phosphotransferase family protein [Burkholderiaceae bacterium]